MLINKIGLKPIKIELKLLDDYKILQYKSIDDYNHINNNIIVSNIRSVILINKNVINIILNNSKNLQIKSDIIEIIEKWFKSLKVLIMRNSELTIKEIVNKERNEFFKLYSVK